MQVIDARRDLPVKETYVTRNIPQIVSKGISKFRFVVSALEPNDIAKSLSRLQGQYHEAVYILKADRSIITRIMKEVAARYRDDPRLDNSPSYHFNFRNKATVLNLVVLRRRDGEALITDRAINGARRRLIKRKIKFYDNIADIYIQALTSDDDVEKFHALNATLAASCKKEGKRSLLHVSEQVYDAPIGGGRVAQVEMYGLSADSFNSILPILQASGLRGYLYVTGDRKKVIVDAAFGGGFRRSQWQSMVSADEAKANDDKLGVLFWDLVGQVKNVDDIDGFVRPRALTHDTLNKLVDLSLGAGVNINITTRIQDIDYQDRATIMALGTWLLHQARQNQRNEKDKQSQPSTETQHAETQNEHADDQATTPPSCEESTTTSTGHKPDLDDVGAGNADADEPAESRSALGHIVADGQDGSGRSNGAVTDPEDPGAVLELCGRPSPAEPNEG